MSIKTWQDNWREYTCGTWPDVQQGCMQAKIDELSAALQDRDAEIEQLKSIAYSDDGAGGEGMKLFLTVRAQRKVLEQALERMDRARDILTDGKPRPECNWGMLATSDLHYDITAMQGVFK